MHEITSNTTFKGEGRTQPAIRTTLATPSFIERVMTFILAAFELTGCCCWIVDSSHIIHQNGEVWAKPKVVSASAVMCQRSEMM